MYGIVDPSYRIRSYEQRDFEEDKMHDLSQLQSCLARREYKKVFANPQLFWLAFCQAYAQLQEKGQEEFNVILSDQKLEICGKSPSFIKKIERFIKEISEIFKKNYGSYVGEGYLVLLLIRSDLKIYIHKYESYVQIYDVVDWVNAIKVKEVEFERLILPSLFTLCEMLGAKCTERYAKPFIRRDRWSTCHQSRMDALQIDRTCGEPVKKEPFDEMKYYSLMG